MPATPAMPWQTPSRKKPKRWLRHAVERLINRVLDIENIIAAIPFQKQQDTFNH
ncbi:MAG: hypothetical protein ACFCUE_04195 [Candidatus Bathyarchaeia archaeon]